MLVLTTSWTTEPRLSLTTRNT